MKRTIKTRMGTLVNTEESFTTSIPPTKSKAMVAKKMNKAQKIRSHRFGSAEYPTSALVTFATV